jgi:pullulanase
MVINYMSAHDNNTLWDKLLLSNPNDSDETRNKMNNLGAAILMISKGTPFWQAGEEMLRTKGGDENSYKSSDEVNNIDWSVLKEGNREHNTMLYYKGLIEMRKAYSLFTDPSTEVVHEEIGSGILTVKFTDADGVSALVIINPHSQALPYSLEGEWNLIATSTEAGAQVLARESGNITADAIGVRIYVNDLALAD